jgi:NadR type nicotinamide-nucleotide adenylyltransferase
MPPHRGHCFLIDFARSAVEELTVLVCTMPHEPIDGALRFRWMQELFGADPRVRLVHVTDVLPQTPAEHPDFWAIWQAVIRRAASQGADWFFASEDYGPPTAAVIGPDCRYVEVDRARTLVPVSATRVRENPLACWEFLPEPVRAHYVKRVCVFGPESTGKTTLARDLARAFDTVWAFEYARPLLDAQGGRCTADDIPRIVRGQVATEEALARQANRVLVCDTDVLTTALWSELLFGRTPAWIEALAEERRYDLYLLLDVDVPWVDDGQRFFGAPEQRRAQLEQFRAALERLGRPYRLIRGGWAERFAQAHAAVRALLPGPPTRLW